MSLKLALMMVNFPVTNNKRCNKSRTVHACACVCACAYASAKVRVLPRLARRSFGFEITIMYCIARIDESS